MPDTIPIQPAPAEGQQAAPGADSQDNTQDSQAIELCASGALHDGGLAVGFDVVYAGQMTIRGGDSVGIGMPLEHLHWFDAQGLRLDGIGAATRP